MGRILSGPLFVFFVVMLAACEADSGPPPALGTLERDRLELVAEANEPIVSINALEGESVRAGDLILELDNQRLAAQADGARALRDQAQARLDELIKGPRRERIDAARARLVGAEGVLAALSRQLERARRLEQQEIESKSRLDLVEQQYEEALGQRDAASAELDELLRGTRSEEIDQARSSLAAAEAALVDLEVRLERLSVRAPKDGVIDTLPFETGERPLPGAVVAVVLADGQPYARVHVPGEIKARVTAGDDATIQIEGRDELFQGRVRFVSDRAAFTPYYALTEYDRGRLSYLAEIDLLGDAALELPTGMPVSVSF